MRHIERLDPVRLFTLHLRMTTDMCFRLNYSISGFNPADFRATNVAIHILGGLLLMGIVRRTLVLPRFANRYKGSAAWLALVSSVLWVVHPLQTESVTYVCQRYESLMGFFYLLTLYCFVRGATGGAARWWYDAAIVACWVGMGAKEVMVTAPLMMVLYDYVFISGTWRHLLRERWKVHAALAASWLFLGLLMLLATGYASTTGMTLTGESSRVAYLLTQFKVVLYYLRLAAWPHPLCLDYGWTVVGGWQDVWGSALVMAVIAGVTAVALWHRRPAGFLGAWFFVVLLPTSSIIVVYDVIFEHRMYLSLAAVVVLAVVGGYNIISGAGWLPRIREDRRAWLWGMMAGVVAVAAIAGTVRRNQDYRSDEVMWGDVVAKQPTNNRGHLGLGTALAQKGRFAEAEASFMRVISNIDSASAHRDAAKGTLLSLALSNMGTLRQRQGALEDAERYFRRALDLAPLFAQARDNLGVVLELMGRTGEAEREWGRVLTHSPGDSSAQFRLALAMAARGDAVGALEHFENALRLAPNDADIKLSMAWLLATCGDHSRRDAPRAVRLATAANESTGWISVKGHDVLAAAYASRGDLAAAILHAQRALDLARERGGENTSELEKRLSVYKAAGAPAQAPREP